MILSACIKISDNRLYTGASHNLASDAALKQGIEAKTIFACTCGFLSNTDNYKTSEGLEYKGYFRSRTEAFVEAKECGQINTDTQPVFFKGLDSTQVNFASEQLEMAQKIAGEINNKKKASCLKK